VVRVLDAETSAEMLTLTGRSDAVQGVAFTARSDHLRLASASSDSMARVRDVSDLRKKRR
jgi:WD40 repeat protein